MNLPQNIEVVLAVLLAGVGIALIITVFAYVIIPIFKGVGWLIAHVFTFIGREISDVLRSIGGVITTIVFVPLVLFSIILGRWSSAAHYGRSLQSEIGAIASAFYRLVIGNPARLFCMTSLVDGIEQRLPAAVAAAPGPDRPSKARAGQFDGYKIVGSLPGGGSGGRLFVAEPDELKQAIFQRQGLADIRQVVIKTFSLKDGSSLPQIVRESRALEAAKKLGLVLDHELSDERFHYIMRYVPGDSLGLVTQRLHAQTGGAGLGSMQLRSVLGYASDLLTTLDQYHRGGLWHKDVKPDNIIVDGHHAHLVDFGLVTPLRSGMTLTTHGTEYFRDPEMVRMALKGVKVHQVDGAKFDIYAAGAVLFSMVENSFPAHGGLSQLTKPCPEAVRWIVRRAMTDYDKRYASSAAMLADLGVVLAASDPFAVKPAELPSMREGGAASLPPPLPVADAMPMPLAAFGAAQAGSPRSPDMPAQHAVPSPQAGARPRIRVTNWWSGRYESDSGPKVAHAAPMPAAVQSFINNPAPGARPARSAAQQLTSARERARAARQRAHDRVHARRHAASTTPSFRNGPNVGTWIAFLIPLIFIGVALKGWREMRTAINRSDGTRVAINPEYPASPTPPQPPSSDGFRLSGLDLPPPAPGTPDSPNSIAQHARDSARAVAENPEEAKRIGRAVENAVAGLIRSGYLKITGDAKDLASATGIIEAVSSLSGGHSETTAAAQAPGAESPAIEPRGSVLFVSDMTTLNDRDSAALTRAASRMQARGLRVLGSAPGHTPAGDELEHHRQLASHARQALGLVAIDSAEAAKLLGEWLLANDQADAIVWIAPDPRDPRGADVRFFAPAKGAPRERASAARDARDSLTASRR